MWNHFTDNKIFVEQFTNEHDARVFVITKNIDPNFEYYVSKL